MSNERAVVSEKMADEDAVVCYSAYLPPCTLRLRQGCSPTFVEDDSPRLQE